MLTAEADERTTNLLLPRKRFRNYAPYESLSSHNLQRMPFLGSESSERNADIDRAPILRIALGKIGSNRYDKQSNGWHLPLPEKRHLSQEPAAASVRLRL